MAVVRVAYGRDGMNVDIPDENLIGVYESALPPAVSDGTAEVIRAMNEPIGSPDLSELAKNKNSAVIIASDHTRPVPSRNIIPEMLRRLRSGNPDIKITILIATGCHRETTAAELEAKFGKEIVANEKIIIHDCTDENMLVDMGVLPSGGRLRINREAVETDLLISEGFIEPHFFAGFSGGRKSILPGIAARETVMANHCAEFIASPFARTGILENNPIHQDMLFAMKQAKLAYIVNVVINSDKKIIRAFAGDPESAHASGCEFLNSFCRIKVPEADIVITSNGGYPLDQNVYQSVKGMTAGEAVCKEGGVIIMAASCSDGHGGEMFFQTLKNMRSPQQLLDKILTIPRKETPADQWQYQILLRILCRCKVILVSRDCDRKLLETMQFTVASSLNEALAMAYEQIGHSARVAVIPDGVSVVADKC